MDTNPSGDSAFGRQGIADSPKAPSAVRPTEITALLGRGTEFEGKLTFFGRVRVDGRFAGEIRGDDVLVIGEGAYVEGTIEVATCIVTAGEVRAQIRARDAIELYAPAKVVGSLRAPAIFIDRGVIFEGTCTMAPLDAPTEPPRVAMEDAPTATALPGKSTESTTGQNGTTTPSRSSKPPSKYTALA